MFGNLSRSIYLLGFALHALAQAEWSPDSHHVIKSPDTEYPTHGTYNSTDASTNILNRRANKGNGAWLRIMPVGASISQGVGSAGGNGYRKMLRDALRYDGWNVNMVGSQQTGTFNDRDHESWPGYTIGSVRAKFEASASYHPNVVVIHVGGNDCEGDSSKPDSYVTDMENFISKIYEMLPDTTVVLTSVIPRPKVQSCIDKMNKGIDALPAKFALRGKRIIYSDLASIFTIGDLGSDATHPNDYGYKKMAGSIYSAIDYISPDIAKADGTIDDQNDANNNKCAKVAGNAPAAVKTQQGSGSANGNYVHNSESKGVLMRYNLDGDTDALFNQEVKAIQFAQIETGNAARANALDDIVYTRYDTKSKKWITSYKKNLNNGNFGDWINFGIGVACAEKSVILFADADSDGLDDLWCIGPNGQASLARNLGTSPATFAVVGEIMEAHSPYTAEDVMLADIDGDGRADYCIMWVNGDIRCWRNGGQSYKPDFWQGFSSGTPGDVVFTAKGKGNGKAVHLVDINGDFRADWLWVGDNGSVETYINRRSWGNGILPSWRSAGVTHVGQATSGVWDQIKFGRVFGTGRADYIYFTRNGKEFKMNVWKNLGSGGTKFKADGVFYGDLRGTGRDDYMWIWEDGHAAEIYENKGAPPNWGQTKASNIDFPVNKNRRTLALGDWDGDGVFDVLSYASGKVEMWKTSYNSDTRKYAFTYKGVVSGSVGCSTTNGVGLFDKGVQFADLDGDGRVDLICLEVSGRITAYLNTKNGMKDVGQIKFAEGWDRSNVRFADVENSGRADILWLNKYSGEVTVFKNNGNTPTSGSSFSWTKRGVLYSNVQDRGENLHFVNYGGTGRADLYKTRPETNEAWVYYNQCPGAGGGDDGDEATIPIELPQHGVSPNPGGLAPLFYDSSCKQLEEHQAADDKFYHSKYWDQTLSTDRIVEFDGTYNPNNAQGRGYMQAYLYPFGIGESWGKCSIAQPCGSPDCNSLNDNGNQGGTAAALQIAYSFSNLQTTIARLQKSVEDAILFWSVDNLNFTKTFTPESSSPSNFGIVEALNGVNGLFAVAAALFNTRSSYTAAGLSSLATSIVNSALGANVDLPDTIDNLSAINDAIREPFEKIHEALNKMFDDFRMRGKYGDIKLADVFVHGEWADSSEIPLLNEFIWSTNDRSEIFSRIMTAIAVNAAWRIQRTYLMGMEMSEDEFKNVKPGGFDFDNDLKYYYKGKGWFFQSIEARETLSVLEPWFQDPPNYDKLIDKYHIHPTQLIKSSVDGFYDKGGYKRPADKTKYDDYTKQVMDFKEKKDLDALLDKIIEKPGMFTFPICEISRKDHDPKDLAGYLVRPGLQVGGKGRSSFCYCLEKEDSAGVKFKDVIDVARWNGGSVNYCKVDNGDDVKDPIGI